MDYAQHDTPRILFIDIETKLIDLRAFGIRDQHIGINQIVNIKQSAQGIHCIGMKWGGQRKVTVLSEWEHGYREMIIGARNALDEADAVIGFNHENFDMKKMRGQFALLGIDYPKPPTNIDIYKTVRQMGFPSSKLDYIAQAFGIGRKVKHPGFQMWNDALDGCSKAQKKMAAYCAGDVRLTEDVYDRLRPYIETHPYLGKASGYSCNRCGSKNLTAQGERRSRHFRIQSLKCADCGGWRQGLRKRVA
jgi:DNA polymerase III epsilon subunit-like protein